MDFVTGFPNTPREFDPVWVIIDILAKSAQFIPMKICFPLQRLVEIYISVIVKLHGILSNIVSDSDLIFPSMFWESF